MSRKENITFFLTVATVIGTLVNSSAFGNSSLAAYFFYVISASFVCLLAGVFFIQQIKQPILWSRLPIVLFTALVTYAIIHAYFISGDGLNTRHVYLLVNCFLLLSLSILFAASQLSFTRLCKAIVVIAGIEAAVCMLQLGGWMPSKSNLFPVTGTWVNPNVTAMFFAMVMPAILILIFAKEVFYKRLAVIVSVLIMISLVALKCRSAFIGTFTALAIIFNARYSFIQKIKAGFSGWKLAALSGFCLMILLVSSSFLYQMKKDSADGRKLVWKVSLNMIAEKPFTGYGYGGFEHHYNLAQANYFTGASATEQEVANSSYVRMAYNEFLENGVEGGIIGFILFTSLLITLLLKPRKNEKETDKGNLNSNTIGNTKITTNRQGGMEYTAAFAGIAAFAAMSVFNFTLQAIPAMCLFIIYSAIRSTETPFINVKSAAIFIPDWVIPHNKTLSGSLIIIALYCLYLNFLQADAQLRSVQAFNIAKQGDLSNAVELLQPLEKKLASYESYLLNYGAILIATGQPEQALQKLTKAKALTSNPDLYIKTGNCFEAMQDFKAAENAYQVAKNIEPNRMLPKYALMRLFIRTKDTVRAASMAEELINVNTKVMSTEAKFYKKEALLVKRSCNKAKSEGENGIKQFQ